MAAMSTAFVVLAAFCWGLTGGIGGMLVSAGWDASVISFYRGLIGLIGVLLWLALRPHGHGFANPRLWLWSALAGLGVAGNFSLYFLSIERGSVAVAATLMYSAPVFVYLLSFVLGIERPSASRLAAIAAVMLGIGLLTEAHDLAAMPVTPLGVVAGLLAGLSYAAFIFGFKYAALNGSPQAALAIALTVLVAVLFWPSDPEQTAAVLRSEDWPLFLGLGLLGGGVSFVFYVVGLRDVAPTVASIVAMVEPVTASLFGVLILHESLTGLQLAGMALILFTVTAPSARASSR
jgi:drug/metabolite transporter (DMT)-like permease